MRIGGFVQDSIPNKSNGGIPENAVLLGGKYSASQSAAFEIAISVILVLLLLVILKLGFLSASKELVINIKTLFIALCLFFLSFIPHEFMHAISFGRNSDATVYFLRQPLMVFVYSEKVLSKSRYLIMCILPLAVLVSICFLTGVSNLPYAWASALVVSSFGITLSCSSDILNFVLGLIEIPNGSSFAMCGYTWYWWPPNN